MFDAQGFFIPTTESRVFSYPPTNYYRLNQSHSFRELLDNLAHRYCLNIDTLNTQADALLRQLTNDVNLSSSSVTEIPIKPFFIKKQSILDIGSYLEDELLVELQSQFLSLYPSSHFKVISQDKNRLSSRIRPVDQTNYNYLLKALDRSDVFGLYLPLAFFQHSVSSQRSSFTALKSANNICLSGPIDIISSLINEPSLLIDNESYSPILCMSGVNHADPRLELCIKSYGPHLEMWILSNVLTPGVEQISEQWSGGITIFTNI